MKLIVQPDSGLAPTLRGIKKAKRSLDVLIFRLDRKQIIEALTAAVTRGVDVRVLTAYTNKGGEKRLRELVLQLLEGGKAGVDVRIIGKLGSHKDALTAEKYPGKRLHIRAIVRDGRRAFMGSQSLRRLELEKRREIGVIIHDKRVVRQMQRIFDEDWAETDT